MAENLPASTPRSRYAPSQPVRLHRRQLFHWIGEHLSKARKINDDIRRQYVACLQRSLQHGLWLKPPREPDVLLDGKHFKVTQPICCFTETSLDEIDDHSRKYGRLGLGFPKRFVLERGGRPVNYLLGKKDDVSVRAWQRIAELLGKPEIAKQLSSGEAQDLKDCLRFVSHFLKPMSPSLKTKRKPQSPLPSPPKKPPTHSDPEDRRHTRAYGSPLGFLEEREWRFVLHRMGKKTVPKLARENPAFEESSKPPEPQWLVPYEPGKDLFTIVFPDNATLAMAVDNDSLRSELFREGRPHVTLLTLEDLGTF